MSKICLINFKPIESKVNLYPKNSNCTSFNILIETWPVIVFKIITVQVYIAHATLNIANRHTPRFKKKKSTLNSLAREGYRIKTKFVSEVL